MNVSHRQRFLSATAIVLFGLLALAAADDLECLRKMAKCDEPMETFLRGKGLSASKQSCRLMKAEVKCLDGVAATAGCGENHWVESKQRVAAHDLNLACNGS